ncbi:TIGR02452 family protein [Chitinophaga oryziterrae]|uniref:TIGR02452 family protein n=1 Tax=Chitinophaga oryziterrae TaxID=1031224 RepID=A0A6N8J693_9BACT|nr:TIGR02452 family protein [Chitinophaga oryziterrae]MVT40757.1 TIGR02452 family protein [Chitinophaga oryziterrae]
MNRNARVEIAQQTLDIMAAGHYINRRNKPVDISTDLAYAVENTVHYTPEDFENKQFARLDTQLNNEICKIEVTPESTFAATRRLIVEEGQENVCCLNFASAKNPGGGFIKGAHSQEETLSRASGLYACQVNKMEMYQINRLHDSCLYTDHMLYSPLVPVFRDDNDQLLDEHYCVSIITSPAVNAGAVKMNEPEKVDHIPTVMFNRIEKLLLLAVAQQQSTLVLGAWGCGVFRNDTREVARWFAQHLQRELFSKAFKRVVFAIYSPSDKQETLNIFKQQFASMSDNNAHTVQG